MSIISIDPSWDEAAINKLIGQQEDVLHGPLTKIGNDGTNTIITIGDADGKPAKHAMISSGNLPAGAQLINTAKIFIKGALTTATAYRP